MTQRSPRYDSRDHASVSERQARHRRGIVSELIVAALLMCKGYRILARRWKSGAGEVDIVATRGNRLAFIEVKRRTNWAEAEAAVSPQQSERVRRAADLWLARHAAFRDHDISFDLVLVVPGRMPRFIDNGL